MKYSFKSTIALLLCIVMISSAVLTSCGGGKKPAADTDRPSSSQNADNKTDDNSSVDEDIPSSSQNADNKTDDNKTDDNSSVDTGLPATGVVLSKTSATVNLGDSLTLLATVTPDNATDKTLTWQTSDASLATVENGEVKTLRTGTVTITAVTLNGKSASCTVTIVSNAVIQYEPTEDRSFYVVTGIEGNATELEIPFLHDGLRVIAIKAGAFEGDTYLEKIIFPNSIEHIYANAFKNCANLKEITLPDSLRYIGESSFEECVSLESIRIPYLVEEVSNRAFYHCAALKTVQIDEGLSVIGESAFAHCSAMTSFTVGKGLETISDMAFDYCTALRSFEMPDTVTTLGNMAFRHAEALESVKFSAGLTVIGNACFQNCVSLDNVELHKDILKIGESCFSYCSGMKNLRILGKATVLGGSSFYECTSLKSIYYAAELSTDLGINNYIFYNAGTAGEGITLTLAPNACVPDRLFEPQENKNRPKLVKLVVEDGATKVNYFLKYNTLPYLAAIELPDSIVEIESGCFDNTAWWKNQPDGAVYIGKIFYGYKGNLSGELEIQNDTVCVALGALKDKSPTSLKLPFVGASCNKTQNTHFGYIFGAKAADENSLFVPSKLTKVLLTDCEFKYSSFDFEGCSRLDVSKDHKWGSWRITKNETCQEEGEEQRTCSICSTNDKRNRGISSSAHSYTKLESDASSHWYSCAVSGCSSTVSHASHTWGDWTVTLAPTCQTKGEEQRVCSVCSTNDKRDIAISSIAHSYTKLESDASSHWYSCAVSGCGSVSSVEAHDWNSENTCNKCLYYYKNEGVKFTFNSSTSTYSVTDYAGTAKAVTIPSKYNGYAVTSIGSSAFWDCTSLRSITIPDSVTSIGEEAFYGCSSLTSITIPEGVTSIGEDVFRGCSRLESITIPNSVTSIGAGAFWDCTSLWSITIPDSVTSIGYYAFYGCSRLMSIVCDQSAVWSAGGSRVNITVSNLTKNYYYYSWYKE